MGPGVGHRHRHDDGGVVAVLFCDLDDVKALNDTFGHERGARVLVAVVRRLGLLDDPQLRVQVSVGLAVGGLGSEISGSSQTPTARRMPTSTAGTGRRTHRQQG